MRPNWKEQPPRYRSGYVAINVSKCDPAFAYKHPPASPNRRGLVPRHYRLEPSFSSKRVRACYRASSAGLAKLAFPRDAFVPFTRMFDVIFKFTVPFG